MIESCRIIYGIVYLVLNLAMFYSYSFSGLSSSLSHSLDCSKYNRNNRTNKNKILCSSRLFIMELLIAEFLIQVPFILSFISELKFSIESSKGIYSIFIFSGPVISSSIVSNDFLAINQLNKFCKYINIADLIVILGSIDFVLGSVDLRFTLLYFEFRLD